MRRRRVGWGGGGGEECGPARLGVVERAPGAEPLGESRGERLLVPPRQLPQRRVRARGGGGRVEPAQRRRVQLLGIVRDEDRLDLCVEVVGVGVELARRLRLRLDLLQRQHGLRE